MSSQIRNETWREAATGRWVLEQSQPQKTYYSHDVRSMFLGSNQLPICAMIAPRTWMQERLREIPLRHDLSEDYRSEEHTSELQSLMRISYAVFCWKNKKKDKCIN